MRILFMGTPDFALFSLSALVDSGENVVAVVTREDKPKGRGYELLPPPVKVYALAHNIPVLQPKTLKDPAFEEVLKQYDPELIVVTAYGRILPKYVLDYPKYGCINVHGSLLPKYRGAAPMQRAILAGEKGIGITTMYMAEGLDTGDMLKKGAMPLSENDTFETVHDGLGAISSKVLLDTIADLKAGKLSPEKQDDALATYANKIEKEDCVLDFSRSAQELSWQIRGLSPIPLAFTQMPDGKLLKIPFAKALEETTTAQPGTVLSLGDTIRVACGKGVLEITEVLPEGKKRMPAKAFCNGRKLNIGDILK